MIHFGNQEKLYNNFELMFRLCLEVARAGRYATLLASIPQIDVVTVAVIHSNTKSVNEFSHSIKKLKREKQTRKCGKTISYNSP